MRKGVVVAGGVGSRLHPVTLGVSKQLLPIFDKPMIFYPLSILMLSGIREVLLISTPADLDAYQRVLGDGNKFGIKIQYLAQESPRGVGQALLLSQPFAQDNPICLVLGDNVFYGQDFRPLLLEACAKEKGATIFGYHVKNPEDFGVVELTSDGRATSIEEKPLVPKSNFAVTGLYYYDTQVFEFAASLEPSSRGELEITDVNRRYLEQGMIDVKLLGRGHAWLDTGTPESLIAASTFVETLESRQGLKIACLEEIAYTQGWITRENLAESAREAGPSSYGSYLRTLINRE